MRTIFNQHIRAEDAGAPRRGNNTYLMMAQFALPDHYLFHRLNYLRSPTIWCEKQPTTLKRFVTRQIDLPFQSWLAINVQNALHWC
jgi:hypothetical protein